MDFLETIKKVSSGFERLENHPLAKMSPEEQEKYIKGLALYANIDFEITEEDVNYLGIFVTSAGQSYSKIYEYKEFAENPPENEMEQIILWLRSSPYLDQFICDMLRKYRHQVPNRREEEMIGEISIMAGYSAIELAWLLTLIIEPDRKHIRNYLESCSERMMKKLPDILESLGYNNAEDLIENYFISKREVIDIFDVDKLDITPEVFEKEVKSNLQNHLFDAGEIQEVVRIEWKKAAINKKLIKKGDELFLLRIMEAKSFLDMFDMLVDQTPTSKSADHKYTYTAENEESKVLMITEDELLGVRIRDHENRSSYVVGVLYDKRDNPKNILKWALLQGVISNDFAKKYYSHLI